MDDRENIQNLYFEANEDLKIKINQNNEYKLELMELNKVMNETIVEQQNGYVRY